jgi:hypothetical protein
MHAPKGVQEYRSSPPSLSEPTKKRRGSPPKTRPPKDVPTQYTTSVRFLSTGKQLEFLPKHHFTKEVQSQDTAKRVTFHPLEGCEFTNNEKKDSETMESKASKGRNGNDVSVGRNRNVGKNRYVDLTKNYLGGAYPADTKGLRENTTNHFQNHLDLEKKKLETTNALDTANGLDESETTRVENDYVDLESWLCTEVLSYPVIAAAIQYGQVFRHYGFATVQSVVNLDPDEIFTMPAFASLDWYHRHRLWKAIVEYRQAVGSFAADCFKPLEKV